MPVYNVDPALIDEAVSSALELGGDVEIIVVDDGSTDVKTVSYVEHLRTLDSRVHVVTQPNSGVATARNLGVRHATQEWVCFLDPDDRCRVTEMKNAMGHLGPSSHSLIITSAAGVALDGSEVERYDLKHLPSEAAGLDLLSEMMSLYLHGRQSASFVLGVPWAKFVRRAFLLEHNLFFSDGLAKRSDAEWLIRLYEAAGRVDVINLMTIDYRVDVPGNISRRFNPAILPAFDKLRATAEAAPVSETVRQLYSVELLKDAINSVFSSPSAPREFASKKSYGEFRRRFTFTEPLLRSGQLRSSSFPRKMLYVAIKRGWFFPVVVLREWKRLNA